MTTFCLVALVLNTAAVILLFGMIRDYPPSAAQWLLIPGFPLLGLCIANLFIASGLAILKWHVLPEHQSFFRLLIWGMPMVGICYALYLFWRVIPSPTVPS